VVEIGRALTEKLYRKVEGGTKENHVNAVSVAVLRLEIRIHDLPNTKQGCQPLDCNVLYQLPTYYVLDFIIKQWKSAILCSSSVSQKEVPFMVGTMSHVAVTKHQTQTILYSDKKLLPVVYKIKHHAVAQLVEALHYKPERRGFDSRWCHWNFSLT
jgi:hypothetical protein